MDRRPAARQAGKLGSARLKLDSALEIPIPRNVEKSTAHPESLRHRLTFLVKADFTKSLAVVCDGNPPLFLLRSAGIPPSDSLRDTPHKCSSSIPQSTTLRNAYVQITYKLVYFTTFLYVFRSDIKPKTHDEYLLGYGQSIAEVLLEVRTLAARKSLPS